MIPNPVGEFGQEVSLAGAMIEKADCDTLQMYVGTITSDGDIFSIFEIPETLDGATIVRFGLFYALTGIAEEESVFINKAALYDIKWNDPTVVDSTEKLYVADSYTPETIYSKDDFADTYLPVDEELYKIYIDIPYDDVNTVRARDTVESLWNITSETEGTTLIRGIAFVEFKRKKI